ncbi:MAG: LamG domain-containing protein, partial [Paludibacteraceae bacterium]|nr:LamG domain-containing protein [Paludibacteraceae bacterium]
MDFTLEFWFNAEAGAKNQTILSNGNGIDKKGEDPEKVFSVGFNADGDLTFRHNGYTVPVNGKYNDNNWHNFTLAVNRSSGNARIYMDGELNTYFPAEQVGRISSDKIFAGARVWYAKRDTINRTADQFFTGMVDEVRLWNLYRQQSQIEKFYNQTVNGNEMGLLLYYPFEHYVLWQGLPEMQFTLEDKGSDAVDGNGNKLAFATAEGEVSESKNIPPVKTKGATSSLSYDWVVNNDGLIITLQEQDYRIEKTIVNFTVNKVQDVNGNYIVSPITWSAYIDRNQLKWMDDAVTVNKKQNEPYQFEMPIVNKGGSIINYSLKNMPSWLNASSESGAINPLEKQIIEFEIDPSLAVGTYDEVVYLTNSNNVTEPLALKVTVEGDTPEWSVDPSKYEFSMAVFAQIKLNNQFSNDEKDMLAAFYDGECVGVANMSYDKTMDLWYAMMTVYSKNSESHNLVYRAWDASKGLVSEATASQNVSFVSDTVYGKPTAPVVFSNGSIRYQNIPLSKGWNWISFNLKDKKGMSDMNAYLKNGTWSANSIVKNLSGSTA